MSNPTPDTPRPSLSTFDAVMIIVGIVIGGGIYALPSAIAGLTGTLDWMLIAWACGALLTLIGALCYAEMASAFPDAGGDYHFLTRAFGRDLSFFYGWARVTVILPGACVMLALLCGDYLSRVLNLGPYSTAIYACSIIVLLTAVNVAGLKESSRTQNVLTGLEIAGLLLVVLAGLLVTGPASAPPPADSLSTVPAMFGLALVFVLFTYGGWSEAAYISAEVRGGQRAILKVLVISIALLTAVYLVFVLALVKGLGFDGLKASKAVGADVMRAAFGTFGEKLIGAIVALAALTSINATIIVGARNSYALGRDWPLLKFMGRWDSVRSVPRAALLTQGAIALALIGVAMLEKGGVKTMVEFTAPVFWGFVLLVGVALIVLRRREPDLHRPFRVPLYPWLPLAFIGVTGWMLWSSLVYTGLGAWVGAAVLVCGLIPLAWEAKRHGVRLPQGTAGRSSEA
jgi:amino acid transporter